MTRLVTSQDRWRAGPRAPEPRTLVDVFAATVAAHPEEAALDDGDEVLTYAALAQAVEVWAERLAEAGVGPGDRVGVRQASGTAGLYVSILAVLHSGAAYVPVDADDPEERARSIWAQAGVRAVLGDGPELRDVDGDPLPGVPGRAARPPGLADDAWVIFTSGSTGTPKGVAVSHRSAAALVDAEARLFLQDRPLGPGDRVLAGLSVAFDASCEEMWLAWRSGATLVPAPRELVRAGPELGPWLAEREITAVSTVPTLAGLWPVNALDGVRLLVFGGEAVGADLVERLWRPGCELWNTYGPTETTVVACAAPLLPGRPVRIGLPLDGWDLAVVDEAGDQVGEGATGELAVGGVGLARYLDPELDHTRFAPVPALGPGRAYRTGDLVVHDPEGLVFLGRADDQVKVNGHRIELGEVDAALGSLPGVVAGATAVRRTPSGAAVLVGYVVLEPGVDATDLPSRLRQVLPGSMVPMLATVDRLPTRTSGKVDREALPWPVQPLGPAGGRLTGTAAWIGEQWAQVIGVEPADGQDDFFARGGSSLTAAQLVSALRTRYPTVTVAALYDHPTVDELAEHLGTLAPLADEVLDASATPVATVVPRTAQAVQLAVVLLTRTVTGARWLTVLAAVNLLLTWTTTVPWAVPVPWWAVLAGWVVTISPVGRLGLSALAARLLLRGVEAGSHPRGGSVHLRLWAAERFTEAIGALTPASAPFVGVYARMLGATLGRDVDLHTAPPVTGMLTLGSGSAVEPEVDLSGYWVDGPVVHIGRVTVGRGATVGARSVLYPGAVVGPDTDVAAGSAVHATTGAGEYWAGSPARRVRQARHPWPDTRPTGGPGPRRWLVANALVGATVASLPVLAGAVGLALVGAAVAPLAEWSVVVPRALVAGVGAALLAYLLYAALVVVAARVAAVGIEEGYHPARSATALRAWAVERIVDASRSTLFPVYSSVVTPAWLRLLGAKVGRGTEISTVVGLPTMMRLRDGAFLADDTMVAPYELGGGWVRIATAKIGRRAFLGNSGMTAPGRTVPKNGLVAVLSATPNRTKAGSSYLGSPPVLLPRAPTLDDPSRTFDPPPRVRAARAAVELGRLVPAVALPLLGLSVLLTLQTLVLAVGWAWTAALAGVVLVAAGVVAAVVTIAAKWLLAGRYRATEHPLWSSRVWRGEVADTFTEMLAAPFVAEPASGTVALVWWLRGMGAHLGRGVWCESHWLPEADLVSLGDGATVGRGCVVQTHLFHDRVMSLDHVRLDPGATLGPHGVILPAARIGPDACVGPASLVLRGEHVPGHSRWVGNPVAPWTASR